MPVQTATKPLKVTNGRARVSIAVTEAGADLLERAAALDGVAVTTWVHRNALRDARERVGEGGK